MSDGQLCRGDFRRHVPSPCLLILAAAMAATMGSSAAANNEAASQIPGARAAAPEESEQRRRANISGLRPLQLRRLAQAPPVVGDADGSGLFDNADAQHLRASITRQRVSARSPREAREEAPASGLADVARPCGGLSGRDVNRPCPSWRHCGRERLATRSTRNATVSPSAPSCGCRRKPRHAPSRLTIASLASPIWFPSSVVSISRTTR